MYEFDQVSYQSCVVVFRISYSNVKRRVFVRVKCFPDQSLRAAIKLIEINDQRMETMGLAMHRSVHYKEQLQLFIVCGAVFLGFSATTCHWQLTSTMPMYLKIILGCATYLPLTLVTTCDVSFYFFVRYNASYWEKFFLIFRSCTENNVYTNAIRIKITRIYFLFDLFGHSL